jgi:hypothetical protein
MMRSITHDSTFGHYLGCGAFNDWSSRTSASLFVALCRMQKEPLLLRNTLRVLESFVPWRSQGFTAKAAIWFEVVIPCKT